MTRVLLLGGTTEASALARALAEAGIDAVFSYAGRTDAPVTQPLPMRIGGFGGVDGLVEWLKAEGVTHIVDATHPFAAQMSRNAVTASAIANIPFLVLERPAWVAGPGDNWQHVPSTEAAAHALPDEPARVFLAIGKQTLSLFAAKPHHHYLLRLVDAPEGPLPLPDAIAVIARGPFTEADDLNLLSEHRIEVIIAKNAGGSGAEAKLKAARILRIPVILIDRPALPTRHVVGSVIEVLDWLGHPTRLGV
ncbi:MAG: cobalt-precorrin-6A reductase [Paracoccaceae bacterium]